ncbi:hypothetical protein DEU56DRAFT_757706 [Suillus clintonianus]|uniref:uncharacterized protein n=1 Tax=Suillus clintonianus TaxID=1904413 RepID=UPI001B886C8F|nr:uncharacterized protein DEU56DRAFT_757706 [Suillus clintonianus]KAG2130859.1 hypothetical protein DEU56DRAFT_757706 [Suillus clintonianus]
MSCSSETAVQVPLFDLTEEENPSLETAEEGSECSSRPVGAHYEQPSDVRYRDAVQSAIAHPLRQGYGKQAKNFVAAVFYNNELVIPYWHVSLIKAIHYLGPDNVFVSIVETRPDYFSGSERIEFLAARRNRALGPPMEGGYDKVVFSNDIFIEPDILVEFLETNDGNYDVACGLDF